MSLEREGGIKVVQKRAPAVEDGGLILGGRYGVVDVLTGHRPGEHLAGDLTHPVWEHPHIVLSVKFWSPPTAHCFIRSK